MQLTGCNIGSFGDDNTAVDVQHVYYSDVTLSNSDAGGHFAFEATHHVFGTDHLTSTVMIKSYPDNAGTVKNITYTGFTLVRRYIFFLLASYSETSDRPRSHIRLTSTCSGT